MNQILFADGPGEPPLVRSSTTPVAAAANKIRFDLNPVNSGLGSYQRWNPCGCSGNVIVQKLAVRSLFLVPFVQRERVQPGEEVQSFGESLEGVKIKIGPATSDAQVHISARLRLIYGLNFAMLLVMVQN